MTLLLTGAAKPKIQQPGKLISARFVDIAIGSLLGAIGGWFGHNEKSTITTTEDKKSKSSDKKKVMEKAQ